MGEETREARRPTVEAAVVNSLQQECWQTSDNSGFHEDWDMAAKLEELAGRFDRILGPDYQPDPAVTINEEDVTMLREAAGVLRDNIIGTKMMLIVTEISEAMESLRKEGADGVVLGAGNVPEELADAVVRILDTGGIIKQPIGDSLIDKMAVNKTRPRKHGKKL